MKNIYLLFLTTLIFSSCDRDDIHLTEMGPATGTTIIKEISHLAGIVVDIEGNLISGANIELEGLQTTTDENGVFFFNNAEINSTGSLVKIQKEGFITQFRFAFNKPGELSYLNVSLIPEITIDEFSSETGGTFTIQNKSKIKFLPNSILNQDSSLYNGQVILKGFWFDPFDANTAANMPGDLRGIDINGEEVQLATQGMFSLDIYDTSGNELLIGDAVELSFYVGDKGVDIDGNGIMPLWYLDEDSGNWIEEGNAVLEGDYFVGEVAHFSFWNCDYPYRLTCISGIVTDDQGRPIPNAHITIIEQNELTCGGGTTNSQGYFEAKVPAGPELVLYLNGCKDGVSIGSFLGDDITHIGPINTGQTTIAITATLLNCDQQPASSAYLRVVIGNTTLIYYPNSEGNILGGVLSCYEDDWIATAYNKETLTYSEDTIISPTGNNIELGEIEICKELSAYIEYENFSGLVQLHDEDLDFIDVQILNGNVLIIQTQPDLQSNRFTLVYPLTPDLPLSIFEYFTVQNSVIPFRNLDFNFEKIGLEVGDEIIGSYERNDLRIELKVKVTELIEGGSVLVKVWEDINKNGIQEIGEPPVTNVSVYLDNFNGGSGIAVESHCDVISMNRVDENGLAQIVGVYGMQNYLVNYNQDILGMEVTLPDKGNDNNLDSDFYGSNLPNYDSEWFFLPVGGIEKSIGLGLHN